MFHAFLSNCNDEVSRACLLTVCSSQSGAWLSALPVSSLGLQMSNDTIWIAISLRVGAAICQPHSCVFCGRGVDQLGHHDLSCTSRMHYTPQHPQQHHLPLPGHSKGAFSSGTNRAMPCRWKSPRCHQDPVVTRDIPSLGRHICGYLLLIPQRYAKEAGTVAVYAEGEKVRIYLHLDHGYSFQPVALETTGLAGPESMSFLKDLYHCIKMTKGEP